MSATDDKSTAEPESTEASSGETAVAEAGTAETSAAESDAAESDAGAAGIVEDAYQMSLEVVIEDVGPCKKHVRVKVPRADIDHFRGAAVKELASTATVPGFRVGRAPVKLIGRRFRKEIGDEVKQKVLVESLEQLSEENDLDPINEPNLDVENIEIPDDADFEYEFDVEVRPDFDLPPYESLKIKRKVGDISDQDVDDYLDQFLSQYGERISHDGPAEKDDFVTASIEFFHKGASLRVQSELAIQLKPVLRFQDAELDGFDDLMVGVSGGETREAEFKVSAEASTIAMRGELVRAVFSVNDVKRLKKQEITKEFLQGIGAETEEELRVEISEILERQATYQQRQSTRQQVLEKITESATWDLPEELVAKQVENALYRETLEMQQAGFTDQEIQARENELRQQSVSTTRQAMKEHFVLDKIATQEGIEVTPQDIEYEIQLMAVQKGENPRRLRARLAKSGVIENLEAQIRERKAVDAILEQAEFEDVEADKPTEIRIEAVDCAVCGSIPGTMSIAKSMVESESTETAETSDEADEAAPDE